MGCSTVHKLNDLGITSVDYGDGIVIVALGHFETALTIVAD